MARHGTARHGTYNRQTCMCSAHSYIVIVWEVVILHIMFGKIASIGKFFMWKMKNGCEREKNAINLNDVLLHLEWLVVRLRFFFLHLISAPVVVVVVFICFPLLQFTFWRVMMQIVTTHPLALHMPCAYPYSSSKSNPMCVDLPAKYVSNLYAHIVIPALGFPVYFLYRFYNFHSLLHHHHSRVRVPFLSSSQYVKVWESALSSNSTVKWHHFQQSKRALKRNEWNNNSKNGTQI